MTILPLSSTSCMLLYIIFVFLSPCLGSACCLCFFFVSHPRTYLPWLPSSPVVFLAATPSPPCILHVCTTTSLSFLSEQLHLPACHGCLSSSACIFASHSLLAHGNTSDILVAPTSLSPASMAALSLSLRLLTSFLCFLRYPACATPVTPSILGTSIGLGR